MRHPADAPDEALVAAARAGDRAATDALLRRHHGRVAALCRRLTGDPHDADDCTQQALIAVVRGLPGFDGRAAFTTWLHRVATNACLDELRRRRRRPLPVDPDGSGLDAAGVDGGAARTDPFETAAERIDLDRALAALPLEFRVAVVLRDLCGLDYDEIATICDVPGGTVRSRISRGRRELARHLGTRRPGGGNRTSPADVEGGDLR